MKTLIINGSHRPGNTDLIIDKVKSALEKKCEVDTLVLRSIEMRLPDGCEECANMRMCPNVKDEFSREIEPKIRDYDIYIVATPTYSDNVTPLTKIFWDRIVSWCSEEKMYLKGKKLAVITHGMEDIRHLNVVVDWIRGVCRWEEAIFGGSLAFTSSSKKEPKFIDDLKIQNFIKTLLS